MRPRAEEIVADLDATDPKWTKRTDKGWRVHVASVIPDEGPKETMQGRRKRLREALAPLLAERGLAVSRRWVITETEGAAKG